MLGSVFVAMSGLNAYSAGLKSISNNISNLNSEAYKASHPYFQALDFEMSSKRGGGVELTDTVIDLSAGELRQTSSDLDLALEGQGYLVLLDERDNLVFARTGRFQVDESGNLLLSGTQYKLAAIDKQGQLAAVNVSEYEQYNPEPTSTLSLKGNISSAATEHKINDIQIYNSEGEGLIFSINFKKSEEGSNRWHFDIVDDANNNLFSDAIEFNGGIINPTSASKSVQIISKGLDFTVDFNSVTSFSSGSISTISLNEVNGLPLGNLQTLTFSSQERLEARYTNGETIEIADIAIAESDNPKDIKVLEDRLFDIGSYSIFKASDTQTRLLSNRIEASNVNLSNEFGDLVIIQRGYQASSQVLSVSNDMIQQLFGIRGR